MKRSMAISVAACLMAYTAGSALAAGTGPTTRVGVTGHTMVSTGACNGQRTMSRNCTAVNGAGTYGVGMSTGTGTGVGVNTGTSMTTHGVYSTNRVAPVVPRGAVEVGRTAGTAGTVVTYRMGTTYYHVTYASNGSYTYVANNTSGMMGSSGTGATSGSTGVSGAQGSAGVYGATNSTSGAGAGTTGTYGATAAGGSGLTTLPRTGGAGTPVLPVFPALAGLFLATLGLTLRRFAR